MVIFLQIYTGNWLFSNLRETYKFDVIMPHMIIVLIQCLFLKIVIILFFDQIWFHNLEFSK